MEWTGVQVTLPAAGVGDTNGIESGLEQKRGKLYDTAAQLEEHIVEVRG